MLSKPTAGKFIDPSRSKSDAFRVAVRQHEMAFVDADLNEDVSRTGRRSNAIVPATRRA